MHSISYFSPKMFKTTQSCLSVVKPQTSHKILRDQKKLNRLPKSFFVFVFFAVSGTFCFTSCWNLSDVEKVFETSVTHTPTHPPPPQLSCLIIDLKNVRLSTKCPFFETCVFFDFPSSGLKNTRNFLFLKRNPLNFQNFAQGHLQLVKNFRLFLFLREISRVFMTLLARGVFRDLKMSDKPEQKNSKKYTFWLIISNFSSIIKHDNLGGGVEGRGRGDRSFKHFLYNLYFCTKIVAHFRICSTKPNTKNETCLTSGVCTGCVVGLVDLLAFSELRTKYSSDESKIKTIWFWLLKI